MASAFGGAGGSARRLPGAVVPAPCSARGGRLTVGCSDAGMGGAGRGLVVGGRCGALRAASLRDDVLGGESLRDGLAGAGSLRTGSLSTGTGSRCRRTRCSLSLSIAAGGSSGAGLDGLRLGLAVGAFGSGWFGGGGSLRGGGSGFRAGLGCGRSGLGAAPGMQHPRTSRVSPDSQVRRHCWARPTRGDTVQTITIAMAATAGRVTFPICITRSSLSPRSITRAAESLIGKHLFRPLETSRGGAQRIAISSALAR